MHLRWSLAPSATLVCCFLSLLQSAHGASFPRDTFTGNMVFPSDSMDSGRIRDNFGTVLTDAPTLTEKPHPVDLTNSANSNSESAAPVDDATWASQTYFPSARPLWNPQYSDWMAQQGSDSMWPSASVANEDEMASYNPWGSQLNTYYETHHKRGGDDQLRLRFGRSGVRLRYGRSGPPTLRFG